MNAPHQPKSRRQLLRYLGWPLLLVSAILGAGLADAAGVPILEYLADPTQASGDSLFRGVGSSLGLLLWGISGGVLILAGSHSSTDQSGFLVVTGVLLLGLGVDGAALLHEEAADLWFGLPDGGVYVIYLAVAGLWLARYWRALISYELVPLTAAAIGLGGSLLLDVISWPSGNGWIEEVFKYCGLIALTTWAWTVSRDNLRVGLIKRPPSESVGTTAL